MRYLLTDFRGNPIYSLAHAGPLGTFNNGINSRNGTIRDTQHHSSEGNNFYVRQSPYSHQFMIRRPSSSVRGNRNSYPENGALFCMVRNRSWDEVVRRVKKYPMDVYGKEISTGNTLLHVACRLDPPPEVVHALHENCRVANLEGATPLHIAASHRCSAAAIQALLDASKDNESGETYPDDDASYRTSATAVLSRMGRAPIHYACMSFRGLDVDAFRLLLDATLRDGNLWIEKPKPPSQYPGDDLIDEEEIDDLDIEDADGRFVSSECPNDDFDINGQLDEEKEYDGCFENISESLSAEDGCHDVEDGIISSSCSDRILVNVMGLKDATGQTPLALLFRRYRERVRCVISTLDRLRVEHEDDPTKLAFHAAVTVHNDLGQLWDKARWIIARLTEERLTKDSNMSPDCESNVMNPSRVSLIHRSDSARLESPADIAVAQEAAQWATEQQYYNKVLSTSSLMKSINSAAVSNSLEETITLSTDDATPIVATSIASTESSLHNSSTQNVDKNARRFRIVHASVGLIGYGCPPELIRLAVSIYPHQVAEMDEDGNLPLHIAVTSESFLSPPGVICETYQGIGIATSDEHSVISDAAMSFFSSATVSQTTNPFDKVIKMLIQQYPTAARIPHGRYGQLPLVMAVECGRRTWEDGIRTLLNAYPPALHNKRLITSSLYPSLLALMTRTDLDNNEKKSRLDNTDLGNIIDFAPMIRTVPSWIPTRSVKPSSKQQKLKRQIVYARSTLFELIRTKPDWICKGFGF